jgi:Tfp pilus assembly protein PilV
MIANRSKSMQKRRSGFGLIEMAVAGTLIAAGMAATVQVVGWVALERKAVERRERAVLEAENLMERIVTWPWDELSTESMKRYSIRGSTAGFLRDPTLKVDVTPFEDAPARKKVVVEIRWLDRSGRPEAPVRIVAWAYRRKEAAK